ncbi:MAG TPA: LPS export ABC transporter periplasmic protein LptC [Flavobacteriaceae bacterium]|nr:LPS export ABC transporter periplasmic protein LptC [Flavobacteriaceae bacterium]
MKKYIRIYKSVIASLVLAIVLFACESKYKEARQLSYSDEAPMAEGKGVNLKYTDSGKIVSNLISEKVFDYSNQSFPYQKFLDGVKVDFWSKEGEKTTVIADYAMRFIDMHLVDLRDNVVIITADSVELHAEQLYWSQEKKWLFTDKPYTIIFKDGSINEGTRFDSNEDFTNFLSRDNLSVQQVEQVKRKNE